MLKAEDVLVIVVIVALVVAAGHLLCGCSALKGKEPPRQARRGGACGGRF